MFKKFKHIPTGKIAELQEKYHGCYYIATEPVNKDAWIPKEIVEQGKDWEEIKDKPEWTILSLKKESLWVLQSCGGYAVEPSTSSILTKDSIFPLEILLRNGTVIHSVRRESDGEVFTIGDTIKCTNGNIDTITGFANSEKVLAGWIGVANAAKNGGPHTPTQVSKVEKLFTTEDGVDIYEGCKEVFFVRDFEVRTWQYPTPAGVRTEKLLNYWQTDKTFSTKEAAEEWVLMNKPCLSINDVYIIIGITNKMKLESIKNVVRHRLN